MGYLEDDPDLKPPALGNQVPQDQLITDSVGMDQLSLKLALDDVNFSPTGPQLFQFLATNPNSNVHVAWMKS